MPAKTRPSPSSPDAVEVPTRERILYASAGLFQRQGYAATGLKQVSADAQAPFGSIYHHFPGGKEQLGEEALRGGGAFFLAVYRSIAADSPDVASAVDAFFAGLVETLQVTDYANACPIATLAGEVASTNETLRQAASDAFASWLDALAEDLEEAGVEPPVARQLSLSTVALLEGAVLLSRTSRSTEPLEAARRTAVALVGGALPPAAGGGSLDR